jgi:hypothetical protein
MTSRDEPRRAEWAANALDLTHEPGRSQNYLTVGAVSDLTGLSTRTIEDSLTREEITNEDNPRGALCRPAARVGNVPLWEPAQVDEYKRRVRASSNRQVALPLVTPQEADERGLVTVEEAADRLGVHGQTLRRHQRNDNNYPPALARRSRGGAPGVPEHVREWSAILVWAESKGIEVPEEWRTTAA